MRALTIEQKLLSDQMNNEIFSFYTLVNATFFHLRMSKLLKFGNQFIRNFSKNSVSHEMSISKKRTFPKEGEFEN